MQSLYKRECWTTLIAFVVVTFITHIFPVYFLFPGLVEFTVFGFPAHYFMTMVVGWLVLIPLYWYYIQVSEKIDQEIEAYQALDETAAPGATSRGRAEAAGGAQ